MFHLRLHHTKRVAQLTLYRLECLAALAGESLLDLQVHGVLDKVGGVSPMGTMTIANAKHVHALTFLHVWRKDEGIFVDLVCVTRLEADSCGESKLLHDVLLLYVGQVGSVR